MTVIDLMNLLQNFHRFAARNIGLNKNGELAESKNNHYLNQNKIKKIPGKYERNDLSIWGIRKKKKKIPAESVGSIWLLKIQKFL